MAVLSLNQPWSWPNEIKSPYPCVNSNRDQKVPSHLSIPRLPQRQRFQQPMGTTCLPGQNNQPNQTEHSICSTVFILCKLGYLREQCYELLANVTRLLHTNNSLKFIQIPVVDTVLLVGQCCPTVECRSVAGPLEKQGTQISEHKCSEICPNLCSAFNFPPKL